MHPILHAIAYIGASAIALTYGFLRILEKHRRSQGVAVFALAFIVGLDVVTWLSEGGAPPVPPDYPLDLHIIDWTSVVGVFAACAYLRERLRVGRRDVRLTLGLTLFAFYAFSCAAYWIDLLAHREQPAYQAAWHRFSEVQPSGPIYSWASNSAFLAVANAAAFASTASVPDDPHEDFAALSQDSSVSLDQNRAPKSDDFDKELLRRIAHLAVLLYGLCGIGATVLARVNWVNPRWGGLWIIAAAGLWIASLCYLAFLRPLLVVGWFALGTLALVGGLAAVGWWIHRPRQQMLCEDPIDRQRASKTPVVGPTAEPRPEQNPAPVSSGSLSPRSETPRQIAIAVSCMGVALAVAGVVSGRRRVVVGGIALLLASEASRELFNNSSTPVVTSHAKDSRPTMVPKRHR